MRRYPEAQDARHIVISDTEYQFIRELVYRRSRINLGPGKQELVSARLGKRLRATRLSSIGEYCRLLRAPGGEDEVGHLIDAISTNHTYFFREESHFATLRELILPELLARRAREHWPALRVWSAACSSGEEPWSIAITLDRQLHGADAWPWTVQASDISARVLARARAGVYPPESLARMDPALAKAYFETGYAGAAEGLCRVRPALAARVQFARSNLLAGAPPFAGPFHVIFCRNVMIYFDRPTQEELIGRLTRQLVPGGWLLVGHSESLSGLSHSLRMIRPATWRAPDAAARHDR
ncbi:chemotaxis protein CheR [Opitutaceae bacterium TAV5]|nr:chemotaxis protein CheR [Opitutaceae bacterium TAV5]